MEELGGVAQDRQPLRARVSIVCSFSSLTENLTETEYYDVDSDNDGLSARGVSHGTEVAWSREKGQHTC